MCSCIIWYYIKLLSFMPSLFSAVSFLFLCHPSFPSDSVFLSSSRPVAGTDVANYQTKILRVFGFEVLCECVCVSAPFSFLCCLACRCLLATDRLSFPRFPFRSLSSFLIHPALPISYRIWRYTVDH